MRGELTGMYWLWLGNASPAGTVHSMGVKGEILAKAMRMSNFGNPQIPPSQLWYPGSEC